MPESNPPILLAQADFLRNLNLQGQAEAVVSHFESGRVAFSQEALGEYIKALARLDRLDNSRVLSLVQVRNLLHFPMDVLIGGACAARGGQTMR